MIGARTGDVAPGGGAPPARHVALALEALRRNATDPSFVELDEEVTASSERFGAPLAQAPVYSCRSLWADSDGLRSAGSRVLVLRHTRRASP